LHRKRIIHRYFKRFPGESRGGLSFRGTSPSSLASHSDCF
jgi:hypothetical protein